MAAIDTSGFQPRTLDKVERLLDLLDEMQRHPDLKGKLAMHGGTAINLFMLDIPRLSVDIDISYVGALAREEMLRERPFTSVPSRRWAEGRDTMCPPATGAMRAGRSCSATAATGEPTT